MEKHGWTLFLHPLFKTQLDDLISSAEKIKLEQPERYKEHPNVKLLAKVMHLIAHEVPLDPSHERWLQGSARGAQNRHWKRAKFGRYRLFFRYFSSGNQKVIIYAWMNDRDTQRKAGDKRDPYTLFAKTLKRGVPPDSMEQLLKESEELEG